MCSYHIATSWRSIQLYFCYYSNLSEVEIGSPFGPTSVALLFDCPCLASHLRLSSILLTTQQAIRTQFFFYGIAEVMLTNYKKKTYVFVGFSDTTSVPEVPL